MFCDLVDSTSLAGRLDPEDLRDILRAYQSVCSDAIARFDGRVAQYLGDGILAYFGYPNAHEDDPRCAVAAGLEIVSDIARLGLRHQRDSGVTLAVRIGIHTGIVVAGEMGGGNSRDYLAVGATPNLAARLQALADPNTLLISEDTHRLVQGYFITESHGLRTLRGVAKAMAVFRVTGQTEAVGRLDATAAVGHTALIGRDREVARLQVLWEAVCAGEGGRLVLLSGEPGIGKSRLLQACVEHIGAGTFTRLRYFCSEHHTQSPLYPVIHQMERAAGFARGDSPKARFRKLESLLAASSPSTEEQALLAELLSIPGAAQRYRAPDLTPQRRRDETFNALLRQVRCLAARGPVLIMFEDLHWIDPSSRELLDRMIARVAEIPILAIVTSREEFQTPWASSPRAERIALGRLDFAQRLALVEQIGGGDGLRERTVREIAERSDGIPLFLEELTQAVLEAGNTPQSAAGTLGETAPVVPASLHSSLLARLDRLGAAAKEVAQVGAAIGRQFYYQLLAAVVPQTEHQLSAALDALGEAALLTCRGRPPEATYFFKHALVQDAAYATLLRGRRRELHAAIAKELELRHSEGPASQELLAYHCTQAGMHREAVRAWRSAARESVARGSFAEAEAQLRSGLELLVQQPRNADRERQEVTLQNALGNVLIAQRGYTAPETLAAFERARVLAADLGDARQGLRALWGLGTALLFAGRPGAVLTLMAEAAPLVQSNGHLDAQLAFSVVHGSVLLDIGRPREARDQLQHTLDMDTAPDGDRERTILYGQSPRISALGHLSIASLLVGRANESIEQSKQSLREARALAHKPMLCLAHSFACRRHWLARDRDALASNATALQRVAVDQGTPSWLALGRIHLGWSLAEQGRTDDGIALMAKAMREYREGGAGSGMPLLLLVIGHACARAARFAEAMSWLAEALEGGSAGEERWVEAEVHRERAEILLAQEAFVAAQESYRRAIDVARLQGASLFESRAEAGLERLLRTGQVK